MLRIGVIGLGYGLKVQIPSFLAIPEIEIVGVSGSSKEKARKITMKYGQDWIASDWRTLVEHPDIDAVSIATPPAHHREMVCAALEANKHVLCEKPFGLNLQEAEEMWESARYRNVVNAIDFEFRLDPFINTLQKQLRQEHIGYLRRIDVTWLTGGRAQSDLPWSWQYDATTGGGVLNAYGSHVIDYVEWLCESRITSVSARHGILVNRRIAPERKRQVTAEDSCDILCELANGVIANISISNVVRFGCGHWIEVYGDSGRLVYGFERPFLPEKAMLWIEVDDSGLRPMPVPEVFLAKEICSDSRLVPFLNLTKAFLAATSGLPTKDLPDFSCGVRVHRVMEAVRRSVYDKCTVDIQE